MWVVLNSKFTEFRIYRTTIKSTPRRSSKSVRNCRTNLRVLLWTSRAVWKKKMMVAAARSIWKPMNCKKNPYSNSPLVYRASTTDIAGAKPRFKAKFKSLVDQYELRELHFTSLLKTKELEVQWNLSRYEQQKKLAEQESLRAKALHQQVSTFSQTEAELRSQLNIYVEKFKQVNNNHPFIFTSIYHSIAAHGIVSSLWGSIITQVTNI
jgi:hypothetical protein